MRIVSLEHLPARARLAEAVWSASHGRVHPLLAKGAEVSDSIRSSLIRNGITSVWIEDDLSEGVAEGRLLPPEVRDRATSGLATMFAAAARGGADARVAERDFVQVERTVQEILAAVRESGALVDALIDSCVADARVLSHGINTCIAGLILGERVMRELGWTDWRGVQRTTADHERMVQLGLGLVLHDIGLIGLPPELLDRDELSPGESDIVSDHPRRGLEMLVRCDLSPLARVVVTDHHERLDGSGYPSGKAGGRIHDHARIAATVDLFHGASSGLEPGLAARSPGAAWDLVVAAEASGGLDGRITEIFTRVIAPYPRGVAVELSDGRRGLVAAVAEGDVRRPVVRVTNEPDIGDVQPYELDLARAPGVRVACQIDDLAGARASGAAAARIAAEADAGECLA